MNSKAQEQKEREESAPKTSALIHQGRIIALYEERFGFNPPKTYDIISHPGAVAILPITDKGELLLISQWRRAAGKILLEIPAGTLEVGEESAACAQRELQEETGFRAACLTPFGGCFSAPGFCTEYLHLFLATKLEPAPLPHDEEEAIDLAPCPLDIALKMIDNGEICDAKTIVAILKYACKK